MWINVSSSVENPNDPNIPFVSSNDPVTVTITLYDGQDNKVNETTEELQGGDEMIFEFQAEMPITIDWRIEITLDNDENVNSETNFEISYDHSGM